jgi:hypothetical protein
VSQGRKDFVPKIIDFSIDDRRYSLTLSEYSYQLHWLGSPNIQILASRELAIACLDQCSVLGVKDKRKYNGAFCALAAVVSPLSEWVEIAKILKQWNLL